MTAAFPPRCCTRSRSDTMPRGNQHRHIHHPCIQDPQRSGRSHPHDREALSPHGEVRAMLAGRCSRTASRVPCRRGRGVAALPGKQRRLRSVPRLPETTPPPRRRGARRGCRPARAPTIREILERSRCGDPTPRIAQAPPAACRPASPAFHRRSSPRRIRSPRPRTPGRERGPNRHRGAGLTPIARIAGASIGRGSATLDRCNPHAADCRKEGRARRRDPPTHAERVQPPRGPRRSDRKTARCRDNDRVGSRRRSHSKRQLAPAARYSPAACIIFGLRSPARLQLSDEHTPTQPFRRNPTTNHRYKARP